MMSGSLASRLFKFSLIFQRQRSQKHVNDDLSTTGIESQVNFEHEDENKLEVEVSPGDDGRTELAIDENSNTHPNW